MGRKNRSAKLAMTSERKCQNIKNHRKKNCIIDSLKMNLGGLENEIFRDPASIDGDYQMFLMDDDDLQDRNDDTQGTDPHYRMFLDSLKQLGNSFVVHADERNRLSACYIMEDGSNYDLDQDTGREMKNMRGANVEDVRSNSSSPEDFGSVPEKRRKTMVENDMKFGSSNPINPNNFEVEQCLDEEHLSASSCASDRQCNINSVECNSKVERTSEKVTNGGKSEATLSLKIGCDYDNDYQIFLNDYELDDKDCMIKYKFCSVVTQGNSDLQNLEPDNSRRSMKGYPKFAPCNFKSDVDGDDDCDCLDSPSSESDSSFREQVMRILRKPYNRKEHQRLSGDMKARKPVVRNKDLRYGREQSFATDKDGKSYLDHFPDLRRKLEGANCRKELNLLRGFFFWLQNLAKEGAFRPWLDKACLDVQQQDP